MKRFNSLLAFSFFSVFSIYADVTEINDLSRSNSLPLNITSKDQFCFYSRPDDYKFLWTINGENIAKIHVDENGFHFSKPGITANTGEAVGIIRFNDIPGNLKLNVKSGLDNACTSKDHNKLYIYSSNNNVEFTQLGVIENEEGEFTYKLEKDVRYVKFRYTNTSGYCGHKYSPVKVSLPKPLSKNTESLYLSGIFPEVISDTLFVNYSNPSSDLSFSCDLENISFTRVTEEEKGNEGVAKYLVSYTPTEDGELNGSITVTDENYKELDLTIPLKVISSKGVAPETPELSLEKVTYETILCSWNDAEGAVSYDIVLKKGDEIICSESLTTTNYKFSGLERYSDYNIILKAKAENGRYSDYDAILKVSTLGDYGAQVNNLGFEEWDVVSIGREPKNWNSFATAAGLLGSLASAEQVKQSTEKRPGSKGKISANIISRYVTGASTIANGNLTTGRIIAGAIDATSYDNHNRLIFTNPEFCQSIDNILPDSVTVWVKYIQAIKSKDDLARVSIIAHLKGDAAVRDPRPNESEYTIGTAVSNYNTNNKWERLSVPFNEINKNTNEETLYILATFTTNSVPGRGTDPSGNKIDSVFIDDLLFIYNPKVEISSISKNILEEDEEFVLGFDLNGTMSPYNLNEERNSVRVELSNNKGDFYNPIVISTETLYTDESGEIKVRLPEQMKSGNYKVRVVTTNYPMQSEPVEISVSGSVIENSISESKTENFVVYPNPAQDIIRIKGASALNYRIYNINGVAVMNGKLPYNETLDVSSLNNGIYFIEIESLNLEVTNIKFIKK